ncbi:hypothetical protein FI667_g12797, partial [Globisporangium splendens]
MLDKVRFQPAIDKRRGKSNELIDWTMAARRDADDDEIAFQGSAFDVVSSWLLGGRSAAAVGEEEEEQAAKSSDGGNAAQAAEPVTLYRPSASTKPSLTGRNNGAVNGNIPAVDGKVPTNEEKEMRHKLLRKSGSYHSALENQAENASKAAKDEQEDKEEQELIRYRNEATKAAVVHASSAKPVASAITNSVPASKGANANPKKRPLSAQEELLEKLREDAARAKAKNKKTKLRLQRKKEEERKQKQLAAAAAAAAPATTTTTEASK